MTFFGAWVENTEIRLTFDVDVEAFLDMHLPDLIDSAPRGGGAGRPRGTRCVRPVLKLLGSEALQCGCEHALNLDQRYGSWFDRYTRSFAATIASGTSEIQRNIVRRTLLGLPRN